MKTIISTIIFLVSFNAMAAQNPLMRACRVTYGQFWLVKITEPKEDTIPFCLYGKARISALSILEKMDGTLTEAANAYLATASDEVSSCSEAGAKKITAREFDGTPTKICYFSDDSFIGTETLFRGANSSLNNTLNSALDR